MCDYAEHHGCRFKDFCESHTDEELTEEEFRLLMKLCPHMVEHDIRYVAVEKWREKLRKGRSS